jgi:aquaporin Z
MTAEQQVLTPSPLGPLARYEKNLIDRVADFNDPRQEWRRLVSELLGTFFLVLAAAGGGMMGHAFPGVISHTAAVTAPALTVMAIILFMGKISGPGAVIAVGVAFVLRGRGGDKSGAAAAQGELFTEVYEPGRS